MFGHLKRIRNTRTNLCSERHKFRIIFLIKIIQSSHVFTVTYQPVDGGEVLSLCQLLVQTPEYLQHKYAAFSGKLNQLLLIKINHFIKIVFQLSVVKPKPKELLWPITTDVNSAVNQSELEENARNRRKARENACEQVTIGFGFASDWLRKWRELC